MLMAWGICKKMRIWDLQSLLVCSIILQRVSLIGDDWLSGWRSWLASLILNRCLVLTHHMWWCVFWNIRTPWIRLLRTRCWRRRCWICKTFPDIPCASQMLGGHFLRLGIPRERLRIPPGTGWGGKDTGWLVTWECPLRTDSASWKSLESFMQLISFCNSCILPVSSNIVSRSSTNFLLHIVSNVEPWNRLNSSISLRLFSWASRMFQFCCKAVHEVDDLVEVVRLHDEHDKFLLFATRSFHSTFDYFCRNRPGIRVFESLLDSQRESFFVVPEES